MSDFKAKMHQIRFRLGELSALPSTTRGLLLREGKGWEGKGTGRGRKGSGKRKGEGGRKGKGGEGKGAGKGGKV